ncbi:MAG: hypothetical protein Q8R28_06590 [Dehalococcoidia bacterium]|nr:hypothetical protein [Dehalococcoidia bacterium]
MEELTPLSFASIDLGFDPRLHNIITIYPAWAGDGPVLLQYSTDERLTGAPSSKITRAVGSKAEAIRILRRHGYSIREETTV